MDETPLYTDNILLLPGGGLAYLVVWEDDDSGDYST